MFRENRKVARVTHFDSSRSGAYVTMLQVTNFRYTSTTQKPNISRLHVSLPASKYDETQYVRPSENYYYSPYPAVLQY